MNVIKEISDHHTMLELTALVCLAFFINCQELCLT